MQQEVDVSLFSLMVLTLHQDETLVSKGAQEIVMRQQRSGPSTSFSLVKKLRDVG